LRPAMDEFEPDDESRNFHEKKPEFNDIIKNSGAPWSPLAVQHQSSKIDEMVVAATASVICILCCLVLICIAIFVLICVLLARDNTPEIHGKCGGLWDFVMVSTVLPFMMPLSYCVLTMCGILCNLKSFLCIVCIIMTGVSINFACTASSDCFKALGDPPLLMYVVYFKLVGHAIGALATGGHIMRHCCTKK
jgi:hypothetical protein